MNDTEYGIKVTISAEYGGGWGEAKRRIDRMAFESFFSKIIGDNQHHVIQSEYLKEDNPQNMTTDYYLKLRHSIAQVQHYRIAEMSAVPESAIKICTYCGSVLSLDKRGCCTTCGAPPYKAENVL